ncbi:hypothetical protein V1477_021084 [Vespula maculifrons]|uniref:Uncharacterized protein n=1 Tax=Vespula maculifrons TaxID=7453 RepID=A0ABD2AH37_VESMC
MHENVREILCPRLDQPVNLNNHSIYLRTEEMENANHSPILLIGPSKLGRRVQMFHLLCPLPRYSQSHNEHSMRSYKDKDDSVITADGLLQNPEDIRARLDTSHTDQFKGLYTYIVLGKIGDKLLISDLFIPRLLKFNTKVNGCYTLDVQCLIINFNIVENSVSSLEAITTQIKVNSAILQYFWTIGTALAYLRLRTDVQLFVSKVARHFLLKRPGFEFTRNSFFYTMFVGRSIITRKGNRKATFLMVMTTNLLESHVYWLTKLRSNGGTRLENISSRRIQRKVYFIAVSLWSLSFATLDISREGRMEMNINVDNVLAYRTDVNLLLVRKLYIS